MNNLLKMEKYQLSHNIFYWCGLIGIFLIGFFTADTYVPEAMGPMGGAATSLADIFNGMVYDSTFLLIIISSILALILGQEFSSRTIDLEVNAGHSRKTIFFAKVISYLIAFNILALVYPVAGCCSGRQANRNPSAMPSASSPPGRPAISLISMNLTVRSSRWQRDSTTSVPVLKPPFRRK